MTTVSRVCGECQAPVPYGANYCPACGATTPTEISRETGEIITARAEDANQVAYRERLERVLGEAYELGELLGRGGFAEVYAARDVRLKRDVAVKTLRFDIHVTDTLLARFQREAQAMAQLRHPNIMPIFSVGEGDGLAYFIMPLAQGETLRAVLEREQRLPLDAVRRIVIATASALHHAHQVGMVHRDIKPDNIVLEGEERRVLVTDFGIAKAAEGGTPELTGTGVIIGTPHYMSPEQASGERALDHRADIYSLGVVAFQMISGELPFNAPSVQGVIMKHITEEAPPVRQLRPECPADLGDAVARCLAKEPEQRWESAAVLCAAFGTADVSVPIQPLAGALPLPKKASDPVRQFRSSLAIYLVLNAVVLAIDLATNSTVDFAPLILALLAIPLASRYAKLWMNGYEWRDVLSVSGRKSTGLGTPELLASGVSGRAADSGGLGAHADVVNRVRSERAVIVGLVARMPRAQRELVPGVVPAADQVLTRVRGLARQLGRLDRVATEIERKLREGESGPAAARDREAVESAAVKRGEINQEATRCESVIQQLREALERAVATGVAEARTDLEVAVERASERARGGG